MTAKERTPEENVAIVVRLVCLLAAFPLEGFAVSRLWQWFVAAPMKLPGVSTAQGVGLAVLVGLVAGQYIPTDDTEKSKNAMIGRALGAPVAALGIGLIVKTWWL